MTVAAEPAELRLVPSLDEVRRLARDHALVPLRHTFIADCETPVSAYLKLRGGGAVVPARVGRAGPAGRALVLPRLPAAQRDPDGRRAAHGGRRGARGERPLRAGGGGARPLAHRPARGAAARSPAAPWACSATTSCARAEPTVGAAGAGRHGRARPRADGVRRAGGVRPPAPRGHGAGQRGGRRGRGALLPRGGADDRRRARAPGRARCRGRTPGRREPPEFESNLGADGYAAAVERAKEYIRAGDAYQVVPSQRWSADCPVEAFSIYRGLRAVNPSPYMYFLDFEDFEIAGRLARVAREGLRQARRAAADRRHAPAGRAPPEADLERAQRAARGREGARRARDARGPRPQRPRARLRVRQRRAWTS